MLDHISRAINETQVVAALLDDEQRRAMAMLLRDRLGVNVLGHVPWDDSEAPQGLHRTDGWQLIPTYVGRRECVMIVAGASACWTFRNGADLLRVLEECPPMEFYVSDKDASYLLCCNHHDVVIGWGDAAGWVARGCPERRLGG
ncbi:hypothetical protein [Bradyrhizobium sp. SZCCHNPS1003]|uniref:hypothetical protein n=1 Tax=Bradyrhizobium sp. SZCCHNPS1003 TaxID=3057330 RepID=UPI0028F0690A|nr:hypothetical protein [Bradyrhizobium sp. SZCCHNPS1003]